MKRTPLKRKTPLRRKKPMRNKRSTTYAKRPRDLAYMDWVRTQLCSVAEFHMPEDPVGYPPPTPCFGSIEADHLGGRGMGQKAVDRSCAPMCAQHHLERGSFSGAFKNFKQDDMREWTAWQIARVQANYERHLQEVGGG